MTCYYLKEDVFGIKKGTLLEEDPDNPGFFSPFASANHYIYINPELVVSVEEDEAYEQQTDMILPTNAQERKGIPITTGVLDYFPLAIAEVAKCSWAGNQQHHPDKELFWDKTKSTDHENCIGRHLIDRGKFDTDGQRHSAKLAWRALALLQIELEEDLKKGK